MAILFSKAMGLPIPISIILHFSEARNAKTLDLVSDCLLRVSSLKYQLAPGVVITVQVRDGRMMAQITGQQFLALIPKSETEWKYQLVDATLKFELPKSGSSPKVTLHQAGRVMPSPRVAE